MHILVKPACSTRYCRDMTQLVAHQGGWDEILLFVAPLAIAFFAISRFEKRARRTQDDQDPEHSHEHSD